MDIHKRIIYACSDVWLFISILLCIVWNEKLVRLKEKVEQHTGMSYDEGVEVNMLINIEMYFKIAINIYSLQEDLSAKTIRLSKLDHDIMHVNLYENYFLYIKKFRSYSKKYTCTICGRIFDMNR